MELGQKDKIQRDYSRIQANTAIGSQEVVEAQVHQASRLFLRTGSFFLGNAFDRLF